MLNAEREGISWLSPLSGRGGLAGLRPTRRRRTWRLKLLFGSVVSPPTLLGIAQGDRLVVEGMHHQPQAGVEHVAAGYRRGLRRTLVVPPPRKARTGRWCGSPGAGWCGRRCPVACRRSSRPGKQAGVRGPAQAVAQANVPQHAGRFFQLVSLTSETADRDLDEGLEAERAVGAWLVPDGEAGQRSLTPLA